MTTSSPTQRQILVHIGNRHVVFGPTGTIPQAILFDPTTDSEEFLRVADENENAENQIVSSLMVRGLTRLPPSDASLGADIELRDDSEHRLFVDIKVKDHDPRSRDYDQATERLKNAASARKRLEVWYFNIERLKLHVIYLEGTQLRFEELVPLKVWEMTSDGIFSREHVAEEVDDWLKRVTGLYDEIQTWLSGLPGLTCDLSRSVTMSEELMQKFAVADREIPILDIVENQQVVASFVPRGLWIIGAHGRIDVITREKTQMLIARRNANGFDWWLVAPTDRRQLALFDNKALLALVGEP